ncbi:MAG: class I SAM-dependent methyltransferase [Pseudonocardiaceae bacterium]
MTADAAAMARTYVTSPFAKVVDAGGTDTLMNLGWSPRPLLPSTAAQRQLWLAERLISRLEVDAEHVVADIGCGKGGLSRRVLEHQPTARVLGVNIDAAQLALARVHGEQAWPGYVVGSAERLPLRDHSVDAALVVELLTHVRDKAAFWTEITRVVRPGGRLVVAAITLTRPLAELGPPAQAHLRHLAAYFAEQAEDIPLAVDIRDALDQHGWVVLDEDLSDGVYGPRHDEMSAILRGLGTPDPAGRAAFRATVRDVWATDPDVLADYLRACTTSHALRYYEYHLVTARAS